jgi:hypothetical protein
MRSGARLQWATGVLAVTLCVVGCGHDDPVEAVRNFDRAAEVGARSDVYRLLGPATRARLEADARRAGELSGRRNVRPEELLAIGWSPRRFRSAAVRVLGRAGDHAEVEVTGSHGEREVLSLVRVDGAWRIELP